MISRTTAQGRQVKICTWLHGTKKLAVVWKIGRQKQFMKESEGICCDMSQKVIRRISILT
jgi:hypothetical protein